MSTPTRLARTPAAEPDWTAAVCAQTDFYLFFPEGKGAQIANAVRQAKEVCGRCPIRSGCLDWSLDTRQPGGVWGGLDEHERRRALGEDLTQVELCWERQEWIEDQLRAGVSQREIASQLQVARATLSRCIAQFEAERALVGGEQR